MADTRIRLTIELAVREDKCRETGISPEEVFDSLTCIEDDVCDGVNILPSLSGIDCTTDFFLCGGDIVERELITD